MKKIKSFKFVLVLIVVILALSVTVFADATINIGEIGVVKGSEEVEFTVPYTSQGVERITILALKGTKDGPLDEIDENILYVDQNDDQNDTAEGEFIFKVDLVNFNEETPYIYIKIGGTSIETPYDAGGEEIWSDFVPVLIYGDVNDDSKVDATDIVLVTKYVAATAAEEELDAIEFPGGTFSVGSVIPADVNADGKIDATDIVLITKYVAATAAEEELDATEFPGGKFPADK